MLIQTKIIVIFKRSFKRSGVTITMNAIPKSWLVNSIALTVFGGFNYCFILRRNMCVVMLSVYYNLTIMTAILTVMVVEATFKVKTDFSSIMDYANEALYWSQILFLMGVMFYMCVSQSGIKLLLKQWEMYCNAWQTKSARDCKCYQGLSLVCHLGICIALSRWDHILTTSSGSTSIPGVSSSWNTAYGWLYTIACGIAPFQKFTFLSLCSALSNSVCMELWTLREKYNEVVKSDIVSMHLLEDLRLQVEELQEFYKILDNVVNKPIGVILFVIIPSSGISAWLWAAGGNDFYIYLVFYPGMVFSIYWTTSRIQLAVSTCHCCPTSYTIIILIVNQDPWHYRMFTLTNSYASL